MRSSQALFLWVAIAFFTGMRFTASAGEEPSVRSGVFAIRLECDKAVYKVGEQVNLRITLTNKSRHPFAIFMEPPWGLVKLDILDGEHRPVPQSSELVGRGLLTATNYVREFPPGKVMVQGYLDPPSSLGTYYEWVDLKLWRYDLKDPGDYTISATPTFAAFERAQDGHIVGPMFTPSADMSNSVHIKVAQ
jgi:hypothetical protein